MNTDQETLQRVQSGLYHLRRGLAPFVEARMKARHGAQWLAYASRASGGEPRGALDEYGLLKTMIDNWSDAFGESFDRRERHRVRNFVSTALEARNATSHLSIPLQDNEALRYLDTIHELLRLIKAPEAEISEARRLYQAQRHSGLALPPSHPSRDGTIVERLLDYVRQHPGLDDDELAHNLGIKPRQSINQAARRLEARGLLRRYRGPRGKIINEAKGTPP